MKTVKNDLLALSVMAVASISLTMVSCNKEDSAVPADATEEPAECVFHHAVMQLNAAVPQFEPGATRASDAWQDGDKVYIQFSGGNNRVYGQAVYEADDDSWEVEYSGTLSSTNDGTCDLYFFENAGAESSADNAVTLTEHTVIYKDGEATYLYDGSTISVTAMLKPMTGRIRFKGTARQKYSFSGFDSYTDYNVKTNTFSSAPLEVTDVTLDNGYTPYFYGFFPNENSRKIVMTDEEENAVVVYSRILGANALAEGHSGYLDIPTRDHHTGWALEVEEKTDKKTITVTGNGKTVTFNMILVQGGTFQMGPVNNVDENQPAQTVTLTKDYYIAETEVTQALWYAVMGQSPTTDGDKWNTTYGLGDDYPAYYISWDDCQSFLTALNEKTGRSFRIPTEAEWEYAARGGNKSMGYTYAGSNTLDDVAWYGAKFGGNSGGTTHTVKTKQSNELGLYDMSGNVWELCADWKGDYSATEQTDPIGPATGTNRVGRGGAWDNVVWKCDNTYRAGKVPSIPEHNTGLRLAL